MSSVITRIERVIIVETYVMDDMEMSNIVEKEASLPA